MQTGTISEIDLNIGKNNKYIVTIILLCIGYFIDFYDLTIFSSSYVNVFRDAFQMHDTTQIQQLFLKISSIYTAGIFCGALFFGILGDKLGRTAMIRYSIALYSSAMILSVFTTSIPFFTFLRFISGFGLAAEFATSSVLINELLPVKYAARYNSLLYFCGILGGMTAIYLGAMSWKLLYLFGGIVGFVIYITRKKILESELFSNLQQKTQKGSVLQLFNSWRNILKFCRLWILIVPFNFLISIMFIYPKFMHLTGDLGDLTRELLTGFFIGNLISTLGSNYVINKFKDYRVFILINIILFSLVMPLFWLVNNQFFLMYAILLGLLGGGLPTVWIQLVVKSYGTNLRSTAANTIFAFGRFSCIGFNSIISVWMISAKTFNFNVLWMVILILSLVLLALYKTKNNYEANMQYIEGKPQ